MPGKTRTFIRSRRIWRNNVISRKVLRGSLRALLGGSIWLPSECHSYPDFHDLANETDRGHSGVFTSTRAFMKRGLDPLAGFNVPEKVRKNGSFGTIHTTLVDLPMSPWSTDPTMRSVGKLMYADGSQMPEVSDLLHRPLGFRSDSCSFAVIASRPSS
jgi:hypothetical protein